MPLRVLGAVPSHSLTCTITLFNETFGFVVVVMRTAAQTGGLVLDWPSYGKG